MNLLKSTNNINKYKCEILISEKKESHLDVCMIQCSGKNKWSHLFYSVYDGYAMLLEKQLIDLPGKHFLVYQINEHSRGGHCEYETQLMNLQGEILNQFTSRYYSKFLLDDKYLWFLKSGARRFDFKSDRDIDLIKLNINTAKVKQTIKLNYPHLLNGSYSHILGVELTTRHNNGELLIKYSDKTKGLCTKRIELTKI
jgi:hypothetical protein